MSMRKVPGWRLWQRIRRQVLSETYLLAELEGSVGPQAVTQISAEREIQSVPPVFYCDQDVCDLSIYDGRSLTPKINLVELTNACVMGRTEFVLKDGKALYPTTINPELDAFMSELEGRATVELGRRKIRIWRRTKSLRVEGAISLLGQCNGNYAHWVTEALARLVLVDENPNLRGLPLLVDSPIHGRLMEALDVMNVTGRTVIPVREYQKVHVKRLVYVTPPSLTPPESRRYFETGLMSAPRTEQFCFSDSALRKLREKATAAAKDYLPKANAQMLPSIRNVGFDTDRQIILGYEVSKPAVKAETTVPRRVFLRRHQNATGNGRLLLNSRMVEDVLLDLEFSAIEMSELSFEEQVLSLQEAEFVVSPIGAAVANLVFCRPGCTVILLSPVYPGAGYYYFTNLMAALGHRVVFVLGPQSSAGGSSIYHNNFRVSSSLLRKALAHATSTTKDQKRVRT